MKDAIQEAAEYASRVLAREARKEAKKAHTQLKLSFAALSVKNRIKVGDYVNHHGFLGIVTWKGERDSPSRPCITANPTANPSFSATIR